MVAALIALGLLAVPARAQVGSESLDGSFAVFAKVMTFDRNLEARAGEAIVIGILYQEFYGPSREAKGRLMRAIENAPLQSIRGLPVRYVPIRAINGRPTAGQLVRNEVDVLYVTQLKGVNIRGIAELCRRKGITTWTDVPEYVDAGLSVGVLAQLEKLSVVVNLPAARAEGANFSSQLLKLARIVN